MFKVTIKDTDTDSVFLLPMCGDVICLIFKNTRFIKRQNKMVKTRTKKVKNIENEEIIIAMTMTIITKIIVIIMMGMRIKVANRIKI